MTAYDILALTLQLLMGLSLAACAGLRAFVPLLALGVAGRLEVITLADRMDWLVSTPALVVLTVAVIAEVLADKIPVVDHALDMLATVVRPIAGAIAMASPLRSVDPLVAVVVGVILGSSVAAAVHIAKAQTRVVSTVTTASVANPALSVGEDLFAFGGSVLAILMPLVAVLFIALAFAGVAMGLRRWRQRRPCVSVANG